VLISGLKGKADASGGAYPQVKVSNVKDIKPGKPVKFDYPLVGKEEHPGRSCCAVEGGIGANKSIVAYSSFCTHLGMRC